MPEIGQVVILGIVVIGASLAGAEGRRTAPGDQHRWTLTFRARLEEPGAEHPIQVDLTGDWVSTISSVRPGEYDVALQLLHPHISGDGIRGAPEDAKQQLERRLARPFWAAYRDDGELLALYFFKDMAASDRNLLEMIATESQMVRPPEQRLAWTVMERDAAGEYLAIYNLTGPNAVVKRKLKYLHADGMPGAPPGAVHVEVTQSELRFSLDPQGAIVALDGNNEVRIGVPLGNAVPLAAISETHLSNPRSARSPEWIDSLARALPNLDTSPVVTQQPDPARLRAENDRRLVEGYTTEALLEAAISNSKDKQLTERLTALFRERPEAAAAALAVLRKGGAERIIKALGNAGSPSAIETLGSIARDATLAMPLRTAALTAFVLMQHPSVAAMRSTASFLDDGDARIATAARLASGALARAGRKEHPGEADRIDAALITRYRNTRDIRERSELLAALGNSVGPTVLPIIMETLRDAHDPARLAAARALRLAGGPEVDGLLATAITSDEDPAVRSAAVSAAGFHHPIGLVLGEALVEAARADAVDYVRSRAITLLRQNPDASPRISESLGWIAEHDPKPGIRRLAQQALTYAPQTAR